MRGLFLVALILCVIAVLMFGFLDLVRELSMRDFFGAPSLPGGPPEQIQAMEHEAESRSAQNRR